MIADKTFPGAVTTAVAMLKAMADTATTRGFNLSLYPVPSAPVPKDPPSGVLARVKTSKYITAATEREFFRRRFAAACDDVIKELEAMANRGVMARSATIRCGAMVFTETGYGADMDAFIIFADIYKDGEPPCPEI